MNSEKDLRRSKYRGDQKTCPECSSNAGRFVYRAFRKFGNRLMADGRELLQSWCIACRKKNRLSS